jgi:hypothetical protein
MSGLKGQIIVLEFLFLSHGHVAVLVRELRELLKNVFDFDFRHSNLLNGEIIAASCALRQLLDDVCEVTVSHGGCVP